jgi:hypothetical protein
MKCSPAPIADSDLQTAIDPEIGAEKQLFVSYNPWNYLGDIAQIFGGTPQVTTATCAGEVTEAGNAAVTVTGAGIAGSPVAVPVAVAVDDTPTLYAAKIAAAINLNAAIAALYVASSSGTKVILTAIAPAANDATLNIAIATGTATGITAAPDSADTTAGAIGTGTYTPNPIAVPAAPGAGFDLQLISTNGALSACEIVALLSVVFADSTAGTATATFAIPARAVNQASSVPAGTAVDIAGVGGGAGKQIASITGLVSIVGGYVGNQFKLVALPDVASYSLVGFVTEAGLKLPVSGSVAIADGFDGSAAIKRGRSEPGSLTAKSHYIDYMSGLARINGFFVTGRIDVLKDDRVLTERTIIGRWKAMCNPTRGDGNDPVMGDAEGSFQEFAIFVAP